MSAMAYQITGVSIVCPIVRSGPDQRKHQSSASLAFVRGAQKTSNAENVSIWWRHHADLVCVVSVSLFVKAIRHWLWYWASSVVIYVIYMSPSANFDSNFWSWSHVAISLTLVSIWIVHTVDILPSDMPQKKQVFVWAVAMTNFDRVLAGLSHSYV